MKLFLKCLKSKCQDSQKNIIFIKKVDFKPRLIKIKNNTIKIYKINNYKKYEFTVNYIEKFEKIPNLDFFD